MRMDCIFWIVFCFSLHFPVVDSSEDGYFEMKLDDSGYVVYCPCMGRFGNQADQFIGALNFAKGLNRTLILPPWVTYPPKKPFTSLQIEFNRWFKVKPLMTFHRVVTMKQFMNEFSPRVWPAGMRTAFCYSFRDGKSCAMKDGNPFGPFWDHFNIDFDFHVEHNPFYWNTHNKEDADEWNRKFPHRKYPVLAFHGVPGHFPSIKRNQHLQKFVSFSDHISQKAEAFINDVIKGRYVAIHLRNGIDMTRVCRDIPKYEYDSLFSSEQCTGYDRKRQFTEDMCNPPSKEIERKVRMHLKRIGSTNLFIATDNEPLIDYFKAKLGMNVNIHMWKENHDVDDAIVDLAILSRADFFIGNCVSSFSAFVRRQRESRNRPFDFFSVDDSLFNKHDEL